MTGEDELRWVQEAKAGNQRAFAELVRQYQRPVYNLCYRMLGNPSDAEDAAQETFLRAYSRLRTYDESRRFSSWLLSVGSHYCIDMLRRRRFTWLDIDEIGPALPADHPDDQPERMALRGESERQMQNMLSLLSPDYRTVVILHYWHQLSYLEIAEVLGSSEAAVKSRLHRARKALADRIQAQRQRETPVQTPSWT